MNRFAPLIFLAMAGCASNNLRITRNSLPLDHPERQQNKLIIGNTSLDANVLQSFRSDVVTESVQTHDVEVNKEQYKFDTSGLSLIEASDDVFNPPLPLLEFPAGSNWTSSWTGTVQEGPSSRSATAKVSAAPIDLMFADHSEKGVKVDVSLAMDSGTPVPSQRQFTFWISSTGIVKRSFGEGTTREVPGLQ